MLDVLIVTAPFTYTFGPSLAPALLKSCAEEKGLTAKAWDLSAEFNYHYQTHQYYDKVVAWMTDPQVLLTALEFNWYSEIVGDYADRIIKIYNPTWLAVSVLSMSSQRFAEDLCYHVKKQSNIKILIGGSGLNIFQYQYQKKWYQLMLDSGLGDTVIIGEGEIELPNAIINNVNGVVTAPQLTNKQLDEIPFPNYNDYDFNFYSSTNNRTYWTKEKNNSELVFLITGSKGCVKSCNFCDVADIWAKYRVRSGQRVADEIMYLHRTYQINLFNFTDSLINGGLKPFLDMNVILADTLPNTIKYEGQFICRGEKDMPEKYFKAMALAGCHKVQIGIESGSESVRIRMGKGSSDADLDHSTRMLCKYNIRQDWNIITGYPSETEDDHQNTMSTIKHYLNTSNGLLDIIPRGVFLLIEGSPMMSPTYFGEFGLEQEIVNGHGSFIWTSEINPTNTFDRRVARFEELCDFLISFNESQYGYLRKMLAALHLKLNIYNEHVKTKKIFKLSTN